MSANRTSKCSATAFWIASMLIWRLFSSRMRSRSRCSTFSTVTLSPAREAKVATRIRAPSRRRTLVRIFSARNNRTDSSTFTFQSYDFLRRMARRVSICGTCISTVRPHSKRETSRGSRLLISQAGRSHVRTTWLRPSNRVLKVWKNSSCERSLPARNCTSSINNTSVLR